MIATSESTTTTTTTAPAYSRHQGRHAFRLGGIELLLNTRVLLLSLLVLGMLGVLMIWAMTLGSYTMPFGDVAGAILGRGSEEQGFVVRTLRLPRVLCAALLGAALAVAGAVFQGLVRNPLVSPDIIGIDAGASLVAVFWIVMGKPAELLPLAAFIGALLTAIVIYLLSWRGGIATDRMILVGIGIGAAVGAGTTYLTVKFPVEIVRPAQVWLMGSIFGSDWKDVVTLAVTSLVLLPAALVLGESLRTMQLGDDIARTLGLRLEATRLGLIVVGCGFAAVAVAIAGPIGFVALMVPHIARMLAGPVSGGVLLFAAAIGAFFLLASDVVAQHLLPVSLPVGIVTAAVGAPYFLWLLYHSQIRM